MIFNPSRVCLEEVLRWSGAQARLVPAEPTRIASTAIEYFAYRRDDVAVGLDAGGSARSRARRERKVLSAAVGALRRYSQRHGLDRPSLPSIPSDP